jgi:hypothetical protein
MEDSYKGTNRRNEEEGMKDTGQRITYTATNLLPGSQVGPLDLGRPNRIAPSFSLVVVICHNPAANKTKRP